MEHESSTSDGAGAVGAGEAGKGSGTMDRRGFLSLGAKAAAVAGVAGTLVRPERAAATLRSLARTTSHIDLKALKPATLSWWLPGFISLEDAATAIRAFNRKYPQIKIKATQSPVLDTSEAIIAAGVAGTLPDIMFSGDVDTQMESSRGLLRSLDPYMAAYGYTQSQFSGNIMKLGQYRGKQYILPAGVDQMVTAYNPALFEKLGVSERPYMGWTWEDCLQISKQLAKSVGGTQYLAMGGGGQNGFTYTAYEIYVPFMKGWGGNIATEAGKPTLTNPRTIKGITQLMDYAKMYTAWFNPPPAEPFRAGLAGMSFEVRDSVVGLVKPGRTGWTVDFDPVFVNFPLFPHPAIGAGMYGWAMTKDTKHPNETAAFLMWMLSDQGSDVWDALTGEVPIQKDLRNSSVWRKALEVKGQRVDQAAFIEYAQYQSYPPTNLSVSSDATIAGALSTMFDQIRLGTMSVSAAAAQAQQAITAALKGEG